MQGRGFVVAMLSGALGWACADPELDVPRERAQVTVELEPPAALGELPAAFRARLVGAAGRQPWLFRGELSDHHARAVRLGDLPSALLERAVPLRYWNDERGVQVQPLRWLDEGERYTLALTGLGIAQVGEVATGTLPRAERIFPAPGRAVHRLAVQCAPAFSGRLPPLVLEPEAIPVQVSFTQWAGSSCVVLLAESEPTTAVVLPAQFASTLLVPGVFTRGAASAARPPTCEAGERVLGACFEVLDDRVLVTTSQDTLWRLDSPEERVVATNAHERRALLSGLTSEQVFELRGSSLTGDGSSRALSLSLTAGRERRHLVLSEVLANPLGPEPASEWVELVNDSDRAVSLAGLWLEDSAGRAFLPNLELAPHETVLLVGSGFRASSLDVPLLEGTRQLELASLGLRGLANSGEALLLVGAEGVVSRFPALDAPHAGRSIARRSFDAADDDPAAFAEHGTPGASPGAANSFD